uniref:SMB domain-containing protein n=1 Tax=Zonotrichia albicollis TaxID=44394 RepID=A0A8D2MCM5_ZONAL
FPSHRVPPHSILFHSHFTLSHSTQPHPILSYPKILGEFWGDDGCTVPYHDTLCYCDLFCNRTVSDCCPDFWEYCLGIPAPFPKAPGCARAGHNYPTGATYRENCNLTCGPGGQWQCEDHACLMDGELIDAVNRGNYGWRAANYSQFWGMTLEDGIRHRLGTFRPSATVMNMNEMHVSVCGSDSLCCDWPLIRNN